MADEDGRPMTPSLVDAKNVVVRDFSVIQPQFWFVNPGVSNITDFLLLATRRIHGTDESSDLPAERVSGHRERFLPSSSCSSHF